MHPAECSENTPYLKMLEDNNLPFTLYYSQGKSFGFFPETAK